MLTATRTASRRNWPFALVAIGAIIAWGVALDVLPRLEQKLAPAADTIWVTSWPTPDPGITKVLIQTYVRDSCKFQYVNIGPTTAPGQWDHSRMTGFYILNREGGRLQLATSVIAGTAATLSGVLTFRCPGEPWLSRVSLPIIPNEAITGSVPDEPTAMRQ